MNALGKPTEILGHQKIKRNKGELHLLISNQVTYTERPKITRNSKLFHSVVSKYLIDLSP